MEVTAAAPSASESTGSKTIADLLPRAAERFADRVAVRHKREGEWRDVTFAEVGQIVREIGLGLIDLGIEAGDRVCILCTTRPEWTYADFAISSAGAIVVPIYPTNSPEECEWVAGNSDARAIVCENAAQVAKIVRVRERLPDLRAIVVIDPEGDIADAVPLAEVRERGRAGDASELDARTDAVRPEDPFTFIYTSGTTGPPKGCVLTHANYRAMLDLCISIEVLEGGGEVTYLYLPLAHSFALLIQLLSFDLGGTMVYFGGDPKQIVAELQEVKPTYLPSVPRVFEKIYTLATAQMAQASEQEREQLRQAIEVGLRVRDLEVRGEPVPSELRQAFEAADEGIFAKVRAIFGGRVRQAVTGAAPIAPDILEFFYACGVPVLEGYGMTETATAATYSTIEHHRFGTVGRPFPGVELKIADDGEILVKGPNIFSGYYKNADASFGAVIDGWLHTGDLGSVDQDGYLIISGRKKDIIITAGGKNLTPANVENDLKQSRWISQAVMHGDRRPYPVVLITLDEEEIVPWAKEQGLPSDLVSLARHEHVRALIEGEIDQVNARYAQVEQVKKFAILDHDLSQETGELTPTLKVKRNVVNEKYAEVFDSLY
jgi:long-chain acyl-CoA synthetase